MNYIDIQEQPKRFAQKQSSTAVIGSGIANALNGVAQQIIQKDAQNNSIKMNNLLSEAFTDIQIETNNYKKQASSDPNNIKLQDSFKSKLNSISEKYLGQIPTGYRNDFLNGFSKLKTTTDNNIKLWQYQQTDINNKNAIIGQTQNLYNQATNFGINNNLADAIDSFAVNSSLIKENAKIMLGEQQANELTQKLEQDYYVNYLNGVLESRPEQIQALMEDKNIINKIGLDNVNKFKNASINKVKNLNEYNIMKEVSQLMIDNTNFTKQILYGNVDFVAIENFLKDKKISKNTRDYLYKKAGYSSTDRNGNDKKPEVSLKEKIDAKDIIESRFAQFRISPDKITQETIQETNDLIFDYANKGYLSDSEVEKYLDELNISNAEFLEFDTKENYEKRRFFYNDNGFEELQTSLNETFKNLGFLKDNGDFKKDNSIQQKIADMKIFTYSTYRDNFNDEIIKFAQENNIALSENKGNSILNPDGSINKSFSVARIRNTLSNNDFAKITNRAYKQTLQDLAEYNNIDYENKTPTQLKQEIADATYKKVNEYNDSIIEEMVNKIIPEQSVKINIVGKNFYNDSIIKEMSKHILD